MQVNGVQRNSGQEPGGFFQIPLPGTEKITFFRDIFMDDNFHNPSVKGYGFLIFQTIPAIIYPRYRQPLLSVCPLIILIHLGHPRSQRDNHGSHVLSLDLVRQIKQVLPKTDLLCADIRIVLQPVNVSCISCMAGSDISPAASFKTLIFHGLPGGFIGTGTVIKLVISIRDSHFPNREFFPVIHIGIMPLNDTGKPFLWRKPVTHIRALVGIIQIPQLPFHGNLSDIMKVLFIIQHPAGEHPLPVLVKGDDGFQFPDLVISRMGWRHGKRQSPGSVYGQLQRGISHQILLLPRIIQKLPVT